VIQLSQTPTPALHRKALPIWAAVLIVVVANAVSALPVGYVGDFAFYNALRKPSFAPPDWLFAPMWAFLNVTSIWALYRVMNGPAPAAARQPVLAIELAGWVLFAGFSAFYFGLQSIVLGSAITLVFMILTAISVILTSRIDKLAAGLLGLRLAWLVLASAVSVWIARANPDPIFG